MDLFFFLAFVFCSVIGVFALPREILDRETDANFYSSSWNDGMAKDTYKSGPNGEYSVTWTGNIGNFVVGKGYNPGGPRAVDYSGTFEPVGNAYLSLYGWTTNPLVEYYIVDSYGTHKPCSSASDNATMKGNVTSDGDTYEIWTKMRIKKPSIQGTATFPQFWSIRTTKRVGGTITTGNHYDAWTKAGLKLGKHSYMILATEGQNSTGSSTITVGVAPKDVPTAAPNVPDTPVSTSVADTPATTAIAETPTKTQKPGKPATTKSSPSKPAEKP